MHKKILIILTLLFNSSIAQSTNTTSLWQLIEHSKIIVAGEIIALNYNSFIITIDRKIKGKYIADSIKILKHVDYGHDSRYAPYEIGQKGIYFLRFSMGQYELVGRHNAGELIILDNKVYVPGFKNKIFPRKIYINISDQRNFIEIDYAVVEKGIKSYMDNQEQIDSEFNRDFSRTIVYQSSFSDRPIRNDFLKLILEQRIKVTTLR